MLAKIVFPILAAIAACNLWILNLNTFEVWFGWVAYMMVIKLVELAYE